MSVLQGATDEPWRRKNLSFKFEFAQIHPASLMINCTIICLKKILRISCILVQDYRLSKTYKAKYRKRHTNWNSTTKLPKFNLKIRQQQKRTLVGLHSRFTQEEERGGEKGRQSLRKGSHKKIKALFLEVRHAGLLVAVSSVWCGGGGCVYGLGMGRQKHAKGTFGIIMLTSIQLHIRRISDGTPKCSNL